MYATVLLTRNDSSTRNQAHCSFFFPCLNLKLDALNSTIVASACAIMTRYFCVFCVDSGVFCVLW